ncbi:uncharacterized [Tachysurus ichikawai]
MSEDNYRPLRSVSHQETGNNLPRVTDPQCPPVTMATEQRGGFDSITLDSTRRFLLSAVTVRLVLWQTQACEV